MTSLDKSTDSVTIKNLTDEDVQQVARKITNNLSVKVLNYQLHPYSSEFLGFSALHLRLSITFQRSNDSSPSETVSAFVKAVNYDKQDQLELTETSGIFKKEVYFLENLAPKLVESSKSEKWSPICYLAKRDVLIMEDLGTLGYKMISTLMDDYNLIQSMLSVVAKFHASSIVTEARLNKDSKISKTLGEWYPEACGEMVLCHGGKIHEMMEPGIQAAVAVAEHLGYNGEKVRRGLLRMYEIVKLSKKYQNTLLHGDLWPNNLMINRENNCVLVDYQIVKYAPPALDLLHGLYINTKAAFRKKHEKELVEFYHGELVRSVERYSKGIVENVKTPSLQELLESMDELRLYGAGITSLYFPFWIPKLQQVKQLHDDPEAMRKFTYEDRTDDVLRFMSMDAMYNEMVGGAVTELAKISERFF